MLLLLCYLNRISPSDFEESLCCSVHRVDRLHESRGEECPTAYVKFLKSCRKG